MVPPQMGAAHRGDPGGPVPAGTPIRALAAQPRKARLAAAAKHAAALGEAAQRVADSPGLGLLKASLFFIPYANFIVGQ